MIARIFFFSVALFIVASTAHGATVALTLSSDKDPHAVTPGDEITFTLGLSPMTEISGYTLDIRYDTTELGFLTATQLVPFFGGAFVPPFTLDPAVTAGDSGSTGLATSGSGRASVLQVSNSVAQEDLFSLKFVVLGYADDSLEDLTVGLLNASADDINPPIGGTAFTVTPDVITASIRAVPLPPALFLFGSGALGLIGLVGMMRRKVSKYLGN